MYNGVTNRGAEKATGKRAGWDWGDILSFPKGFELYVKKQHQGSQQEILSM